MERTTSPVTCVQCAYCAPAEPYYHCLQCYNIVFCELCVGHNAQCRGVEENHHWIKRRLQDGSLLDIGLPIWSSVARAIQYPTLFQLPSVKDTPQSLFSSDHRYIRKSDSRQILIFTDGACSRNGCSDAQAGYSFSYRPSAYSKAGELTHDGTMSLRLETRGPTGQIYPQTSNRAELRAVIAALQFKDWSSDCNEGWRSLVFATDPEYVGLHITQSIQRWESEGWMTSDHRNIMNQDLWKLLLSLIRTLQGDGVAVSFWRIPRDWNKRADEAAKMGAQKNEEPHFGMVKPRGPLEAEHVLYRC
ncbi:Ribonuclease H [Lachnellula cervina]|uniref:ribonuclease H n=1 Tax=Lachnellula cervina TaxID=1316786 RepID=A0A7D8YH44_9HELO|nr:Ribonuclease H [Lachnellula cervina]